MLSDSEVLAIAQLEVQSASGVYSGDLAEERATAMDYYMGEPYGDEVEGRSAIVTREVLETVEWILPSLVRIFCDSENLVVFEPVGPDDEEQAEQETDVCNHVFWKQNEGFYNVYTFLKDALLSKTGILKTWWSDEETEEREEYKGIEQQALIQLLSDDSVEREIIDGGMREDGLYEVVFKTKKNKGRVVIEPVAPEEFGVSASASSPYAKKANAVWQRSRKNKNQLIALGYDKEKIKSLPTADDDYTAEKNSRRHLSDERQSVIANTGARDEYWITEVHLYIDRDEDDIAELLKVTYAAGESGSASATLLDIEEVDRIPFATAPPNILTHKFYGQSIADLSMDIQRTKSAILRQMMDNAYLANNGRTIVNDDLVNMDDLLTNRVGGVVRVSGEQPGGQFVTPFPHAPLAPHTFDLMGYLDEEKKRRIGTGDNVLGLDKTALSQINTGVYAQALDASRMQIELIARILGEVGFVPLFKDIHELLQKNNQKPLALKLKNKWVNVNPAEWRERENITVKVGVGQVSRERRILAMDAVIQRQQQIAEGGGIGTLVMPNQLYNAHKEWTKAWGLEPDLYWTDPSTLPPKPPEGPAPEMIVAQQQAQAMLIDAQSKVKRADVEMMKVQAQERMQAAELGLKLREQELKGEIASLQGRLNEFKAGTDASGKAFSLQQEMDKREVETNLRAMEMRLDAVNAERDRALKEYDIQVKAALELAKIAQGEAQQAKQIAADEKMAKAAKATEKPQEKSEGTDLAKQLAEMQKRLEESTGPQPIERDANGLITAIGKRKLKRDADGKVISIG